MQSHWSFSGHRHGGAGGAALTYWSMLHWCWSTRPCACALSICSALGCAPQPSLLNAASVLTWRNCTACSRAQAERPHSRATSADAWRWPGRQALCALPYGRWGLPLRRWYRALPQAPGSKTHAGPPATEHSPAPGLHASRRWIATAESGACTSCPRCNPQYTPITSAEQRLEWRLGST